jgi:flagellar biosynthesis protein FlhF
LSTTANDSESQRVRTFTASTLREALGQVRAQLGADALILGQQQHGRHVSVQAALEVPADVPDTAPGVADVVVPESVAAESAAHIADFTPQITPRWAQAYSADVLRQSPSCDSLDEVRQFVSSRINYAHKSIHTLQGRYRFIGAPGVGKTTSLIKVLVEWVMHSNPRDVVVITTDKQRLAGTEALHLTCQMLNVVIQECTESELATSLARVARKPLVLIDTPAMHLRRPVRALAGVSDLWVCSALHSSAVLQAQYERVGAVKPVGVLVTQLDQSAESDELANLLYQWRLPVYWLGTDCELPGGIEQADSESVYLRFFPKTESLHLDVAV